MGRAITCFGLAAALLAFASGALRTSPAWGGGGAETRPSQARGIAVAAYVLRPFRGEIGVVGASPPALLGTIFLSGPARRIAASGDGGWVAACGARSVWLIDTRTMAPPLALPAVADGASLAFHPDGSALWVGDWGTGAVGVFVRDPQQGWRPDGEFDVGSGVAAMLFSADGRTCFVACRSGVQFVDVPGRRVRAVARTKRGSSAMALSPDGKRLYVMNPGIDTVYAVDAAGGAIVGDVELPARPNDLALAADGSRLFVTASDGSDPRALANPADAVVVIDCSTFRPLDHLDAGVWPTALALHSGLSRLLVAPSPVGPDVRTSPVSVLELRGARGDVTHAPHVAGRVGKLLPWPDTPYVLAVSAGAGTSTASFIHAGRGEITGVVPIPPGATEVCLAAVGDLAGAAFLTEPPPPPPRAAPLRTGNPPTTGSTTRPVADTRPEVPAVTGPPVPRLKLAPTTLPAYDPAMRGGTGDRFPPTLKVVAEKDLTPQERARVTATRVTLRFQAAAPQGVFAELAAQAGTTFRPRDPSFWAKNRRPVTIDVADAPLWLALGELAERSGYFANIGPWPGFEVATQPVGLAAQGPHVVSGAFLLSATPPRATGVRGAGRRPTLFEVGIWNHPEPKLWVLAGARQPTLTEVVDEQGKPFVIPKPGTPLIMEGSNMNVRFHRPPDGGRRVARLAGVGHVFAVVEADRVEVDNLLESPGVERTAGGLRVRVDPVKREPARSRGFEEYYVIRLAVAREGRDDAAWGRVRQLISGSRFRAVDAAGRELYHEGALPAPRDADGHVIVMQVPKSAPTDPWGGAPPARLVIEVPTKVVELDVPFLFEDLPLPPDP
jgi:DNA-binding beta-propeller fold protein YncE